jgi:hypothetical protein
VIVPPRLAAPLLTDVIARPRRIEVVLATALWLLTPLMVEASDGKWTPRQVLELDAKELRAHGLELAPSKLWDAKKGSGLLAGAVNLSGCSGAFVSKTGLAVSNHHCVFPILQEHASPERDLIRDGFLARKSVEELPGKGARIQVPKRFRDVTKEVLAAVPAEADDLARFRAIEGKQKSLVLECEKTPGARCSVASFGGGLEYTLIESIDIQDVRLVYAPPLDVGEFGGEIDNWSWPRHTGDFAIVRAYVGKDGAPAPYSAENIPFTPEFFFPISSEGVRPGDFVMVLGYPGYTVRELLAPEMELRSTRFFPAVIEAYGEMIQILDSVQDPAGKIAVASFLKALRNRHKNAEGQIEGLARGRLVEKKRQAEQAVVDYLEKGSRRDALAAREALLAELELAKKTWSREFLLDASQRTARALYLATTIARLSTEREKPDLERDPQFMDREHPRLRDRLDREQKNLFLPADKKLFAAWVRRALALSPEERIAGIDRFFGSKATPLEVEKKIEQLYSKTKVLDLEARKRMFDARSSELRAGQDPLLDLGFVLAAELDALKVTADRRSGASSRLRPTWWRAVLDHAKKPIAPDANGTLRVTFAHVQGYAPRDGVAYTPQTTLSGMIAKHTGSPPFIVPDRVRAAAAAKKLGRWADPKLKDLPLCFLADADTTGGNSGSPVVDGRGRLVGVNFDRVWENVAGDFGFNPELSRNISADIRYMLWMLDQVEDASALLGELGVKR